MDVGQRCKIPDNIQEQSYLASITFYFVRLLLATRSAHATVGYGFGQGRIIVLVDELYG